MSSELNFQDLTSANSDANWLTWLFLAESIFGFLTNLVNMAVFANQRRFKEIRYKFLLVKSIANLIYFMINILSPFFTYCIGSMRMFILLGISIRTHLIMSKQSSPSKYRYIFASILIFIISFLTYSFIPFAYEIIQIPGTNYYLYTYNSFGSSMAFKILTIVVFLLFVLITIIVFVVLNLSSFIRLKKWLRKRRAVRVVNSQNVLFETESNIAAAIARRNEALANLKNSSHDEGIQIKKNLTKTIIISVLFHVVCELAFAAMFSLILIYPNNLYKYSMIGTIIFNMAPAFNLFIYYFFNKLFKKALWSMFKRSKT